jgi:hypothetical protein
VQLSIAQVLGSSPSSRVRTATEDMLTGNSLFNLPPGTIHTDDDDSDCNYGIEGIGYNVLKKGEGN